MESIDILKTAYKALDNKKAEDIRIINISENSVIADYFLMASAANQNQLAAMQDAVEEALHREHVYPSQIEGNRSSTWILMDYEDVIVHLFSREDRLFYDLERIWQDGEIIDPESL